MIIKLTVLSEQREAAFLKKHFTEYCEKYCKFLFQSVLFYEISTPVLMFLKPYFSWKFSSFFILLTFSSLKKAILSKNERGSRHFASHNIEGTILENVFLKIHRSAWSDLSAKQMLSSSLKL